MLDPLTIERVARISDRAPIAIALSGGGDSVALLRLLTMRLGAAALHALIVDHALREGSAADAERARGFAVAQGVAADVLTVAWPNGVKRGQAAARAARYAILCDRARELGVRVIVVAHTADDQIETVLMRASGGSSWRGLAGMAAFSPAPVWPEGRGLWLARPLLEVRRAALRARLRERHADWLEDPANSNAAFERVRVRAYMAAREAAGVDVMRLAALAARIRPHLERLDREAGEVVARAASFEGPRIRLDRAVSSAPAPVRQRVLSALITAAAGAAREPAADAIARLDARMTNAAFAGAALGGAHVAVRGGALLIERDPGALAGRADGAPGVPPMALTPHRLMVWDGRLELSVAEPGWRIEPAADGAVFTRGGVQMPVEALTAPNKAAWLLSQRVAHVLGAYD